MTFKMRYLTIIVVGILMAANATASDESPIILAGVGTVSCKKFIADTEDDESFRTAYFFWSQGFLSGLNYKYFLNWASATNLSGYAAMKIWIKNYCEENPLDSYGVATEKLWHELRARQGLEPDRRLDSYYSY